VRRRTSVDRAYARKFGQKLDLALQVARKGGWTVEAFAESLGVTRAGLHKYRNGQSVPGINVIEKARRLWKVEVKYGDLAPAAFLQDAKSITESAQMLLPLAFHSLSSDQLQVEIGRKTNEYVQLNIRVLLKKDQAS
jgi:transcriptional regulator with XRE-family HTH domain